MGRCDFASNQPSRVGITKEPHFQCRSVNCTQQIDIRYRDMFVCVHVCDNTYNVDVGVMFKDTWFHFGPLSGCCNFAIIITLITDNGYSYEY